MELKANIIDKVRALQKKSVDELTIVMEDAQNSANDYGTPRDRYDSYRAQMLRKKDMFAQQLFKAKEQLEVLGKIELDKEYEKVEFGSLVITSHQNILVSIGLGKFMFQSKEYFAISPIVSIFNAMRNKSVGDTIEFRGNTIEILEIY